MLRFLLLIATAIPLCSQPVGEAHIPLPADLHGTLAGTEYKIRVPGNWNGTLLVWAHGSASGSLQIAPQTFPPTPLEEDLLTRGYALAGAFYEDDVKEGRLLTLALTNFFNGQVGKPRRTIVWGISLGGTVTLDSIESYHAVYDGAIAVAPVAAGVLNDADWQLRFDVAYAAAFGWPSDSWGPIEDLRDDLYGNEANLIMPVFRWANQGNFGQWEFIRLVMKMPKEAWWDLDPLVGLQGYALAGWKSIAIRSHLEQQYRGPVAQNIGVVYSLEAADKAYLGTLGVNATDLLEWMNAHTNIAARRSARELLSHNGTPSGKLRRPVVTMHGIFDELLPPSHEAVYRALVEAAGSGDKPSRVPLTRAARKRPDAGGRAHPSSACTRRRATSLPRSPTSPTGPTHEGQPASHSHADKRSAVWRNSLGASRNNGPLCPMPPG
jgi:hypothetical protein